MLQGLTSVGIALTGTSDLDELLERIVTEARHFAHCDGGTLYIREGADLYLTVWQNETLRRRGGPGGEVLNEGARMPADVRSIAGWVATTGRAVMVSDAYALPSSAPFHFDGSWDERNHYRTQSVLAVPMHDPSGDLVGVLQLVNALEDADTPVPFPPQLEPMVRSLASQAAVAIRNAQLTEQLRSAYYETVVRLSIAAEYREPNTASHIQRVSQYARVVASALGFSRDDVDLLRFAAPMHDIGKLGVPDSILLKRGPLSDEEWTVMQEHTVIGHRILAESSAPVMRASAEVAFTHHERWDGAGYPRGLAGEEIPLNGRIIAMVDALDCVSSVRVYKPASSFEEALDRIAQDAGHHFDPLCAEALLSRADELHRIYLQVKDVEHVPPPETPSRPS